MAKARLVDDSIVQQPVVLELEPAEAFAVLSIVGKATGDDIPGAALSRVYNALVKLPGYRLYKDRSPWRIETQGTQSYRMMED